MRYRSGRPPSPPPFEPAERDPAALRRYRRAVDRWWRLAKHWMPRSEGALLLYGALKGEATKELEFVSLDRLEQEDGIDHIFELLEAPFGERPIFRKGALFNAWERITRSPTESMRAWIARYERTARNLLDVEIDVRRGVDEESQGYRWLFRTRLSPECVCSILIANGQSYEYSKLIDASQTNHRMLISFAWFQQSSRKIAAFLIEFRKQSGRNVDRALTSALRFGRACWM